MVDRRPRLDQGYRTRRTQGRPHGVGRGRSLRAGGEPFLRSNRAYAAGVSGRRPGDGPRGRGARHGHVAPLLCAGARVVAAFAAPGAQGGISAFWSPRSCAVWPPTGSSDSACGPTSVAHCTDTTGPSMCESSGIRSRRLSSSRQTTSSSWLTPRRPSAQPTLHGIPSGLHSLAPCSGNGATSAGSRGRWVERACRSIAGCDASASTRQDTDEPCDRRPLGLYHPLKLPPCMPLPR